MAPTAIQHQLLRQQQQQQSSLISESIMCPVCLSAYGGRIRQCRAGHSVCDSCFSRLTECPTCRGAFAPEMRNYALEDVMQRLHQSGLTAVETAAAGDGDQKAEKKSAKKRGKHFLDPPLHAIISQQPPGQFLCLADNACGRRLPACRLLSHLRQLHADVFIASNANLLAGEEFSMQLTVSLQRSARQAIYIRRAGVFFLCYDAPDAEAEPVDSAAAAVDATTPTHFVWLQAASSCYEARRYAYKCRLSFVVCTAAAAAATAAGSKGPARVQRQRIEASYQNEAVLDDEWLARDVRTKRCCLAVRTVERRARAQLEVTVRLASGGDRLQSPEKQPVRTDTLVLVQDVRRPAAGAVGSLAAVPATTTTTAANRLRNYPYNV